MAAVSSCGLPKAAKPVASWLVTYQPPNFDANFLSIVVAGRSPNVPRIFLEFGYPTMSRTAFASSS